uniref:3-hydroxyisobutyryl-CoA hydrolase n=1 Tax=Salix viminalis TaxID=40686 RepID=A0A6N2KPL0_SALVM
MLLQNFERKERVGVRAEEPCRISQERHKMVSFRFHQYQVVGRALPTESDEHPKIYRMKLWATNEVRSKSKFWYFLRKLKKVKKSNGQILAINEIFEKSPTKIKNYGIWLRYQSRTGYHNMYKEYRDTTLNGAVEQMYTEMASRHRVRSPCIQIIKTATIPAKLCKRESTKQFHNSKIKFPLVFKKFLEMAQEVVNPEEQVVLGEEIDHVRLITLNRPRQLNVISSKVVSLLADFLEKWEKDDNTKLILIKGAGRAFSAGGDLKMFYDGRTSEDSCLEVVYRMYWLCHHIHTYKKTQVALVHGISMGGGASLMVPMKFSVVTEKTVGFFVLVWVFSTPEASIGFHTDCGFSYMLSRLPGHLGEFLALTGARLNGKELVAAGMATHFVPLEKLPELEKRLISLNSGDENAVKSVIEEFSVDVQLDEGSVLNKLSVIDECFCKDTVVDIIKSFELESSKEGNGWTGAVLKGLKRSSPTGLKITLRSIREGRKQTLADCMKKEFRLTMNILRTTISADVYEGIRALTIDKDNAPKWDPPTFDEVDDSKVDLVFQPFKDNLELQVSENEKHRWSGKYEHSAYAALNATEMAKKNLFSEL